MAITRIPGSNTALILLYSLFGYPLCAQANSDWSEWRSAPNFPGIKIRVLCGTYLESTGNAQWAFQFINAYPKKVYLLYQEESGDSTGTPPKFSSPSGHYLNPGQKSDVYTNYLKGSCEARTRLYIRVISIKDEQGVPIPVKEGMPRSGSFESPGRANSGSQGTAGSTGSNPPTLVAASAGQRVPSVTTTSQNGLNGDVSGTTWTCQVDRYSHIGGEAAPLSHQEFRFLITFSPNGSVSAQGIPATEDAPNVSRWKQNGTTVKWSDLSSVESGEGRQYAAPGGAQMLYETNLAGNRMRGGITFLSTKAHDEHTDLDCQLQFPAK
jgi:hypothetical protein